MPKTAFKPASAASLKLRDEDILKQWVIAFESRPDVTRNKDGSFDVGGDLELSQDEMFRAGDLDLALLRKYVRFRKVGGNYSARPTEFFALLPKKVRGDVIMIGNMGRCVLTAGCDYAGRIMVTLIDW